VIFFLICHRDFRTALVIDTDFCLVCSEQGADVGSLGVVKYEQMEDGSSFDLDSSETLIDYFKEETEDGVDSSVRQCFLSRILLWFFLHWFSLLVGQLTPSYEVFFRETFLDVDPALISCVNHSTYSSSSSNRRSSSNLKLKGECNIDIVWQSDCLFYVSDNKFHHIDIAFYALLTKSCDFKNILLQ